MIAEFPMISEVFKSSALLTTYRPISVNTARTNNIEIDQNAGVYQMLWLTTPSRKGAHKDRWTRHMKTITTWLRIAQRHNVYYFVVGPHNNTWSEPEIRHMVSDTEGFMRYYNLCQFGYTVNPLPNNVMSSSQVVCYTNSPFV